MNVTKYTIINNRYLTTSKKLIKEEIITFLFSYYNGDHFKVHSQYIEESNTHDDIIKLEVNNKKAKNLLYQIETIDYDIKGNITEKKQSKKFISKKDTKNLLGKPYTIDNPELSRLDFLDDDATVVEKISDLIAVATTTSGEVYKLTHNEKLDCFIVEHNGEITTTIPEMELVVISTINGEIIK